MKPEESRKKIEESNLKFEKAKREHEQEIKDIIKNCDHVWGYCGGQDPCGRTDNEWYCICGKFSSL